MQIFRGKVWQRTTDLRLIGLTVCRVYGQVEIEQHRLTIVSQQDVRGLDITMQNAPFVSVSQGVRQPLTNPKDRIDIRR